MASPFRIEVSGPWGATLVVSGGVEAFRHLEMILSSLHDAFDLATEISETPEAMTHNSVRFFTLITFNFLTEAD